MLIRDPSQARNFRLQLEAGNRKQPGGEIRSRFVVAEASEGRNEAPLRHFVHIDPRRSLDSQPGPQGPFTLADDDLKCTRIPAANASNRVLKRRIGLGDFPCHHTVMAAGAAGLPLPGENS